MGQQDSQSRRYGVAVRVTVINIDVDTREFNRVLSAIPPAVQNSVRQELSIEIAKVQEEARRTHRHRTRTGTLRESLQTKVEQSGYAAELYVESDMADYGIFVVQGHGTWAPDNFLEQALTKKESEIVQGLDNAVEHAIKEVT